MGNYISTAVLPDTLKRKRTDSGSIEHDFNTVLQRDATLTETSFDTQTTSPAVDEDTTGTESETGQVSLSQLNTYLNRLDRDRTSYRTGYLGFSESNRSNRNPEYDNLMYSSRRIARAIDSHNQATSSNRPKLITTSSIQPHKSNPTKSTNDHNEISSVETKLSTPARKKMKSTTDYIYTHLFLNGEESDLTVHAHGKEWKLHKIYLRQSHYFETMFNNASRWKESNQTSIQIALPDPNITEKALFIAFGSFYSESIEIVPTEVVSVLACASLLSLDGLIDKCAEIMIDSLNFKSVIEYYEASLTYGVKSVTDATLKWLSSNLVHSSEFFLSDLKLSLFEEILSSNDLIVIQVETDVYTLCKKWLYFQLNRPKESPPSKLDKNWQKTCNNFFKKFLDTDIAPSTSVSDDSGILSDLEESAQASLIQDVGSTSFATSSTCQDYVTKPQMKECLLDKPSFKKYTSVFRKIRLQHILTDMASLHVLYSDRIIPHTWFEPYYFRNWLNTIYIDQDQLSYEFDIKKEDFDTQCARFGRVLVEDAPASWRWVGFNYGIDLLISHSARRLTLKRNTVQMPVPYKGLLSQKNLMRIFYVMKVVKLDAFGNETWSSQSEVTCLDLSRNEEKAVFAIHAAVEYPVLLNFRVMTHTCHPNLVNNLFN